MADEARDCWREIEHVCSRHALGFCSVSGYDIMDKDKRVCTVYPQDQKAVFYQNAGRNNTPLAEDLTRLGYKIEII